MQLRIRVARRLYRFYRQAGQPRIRSAIKAWRIAK